MKAPKEKLPTVTRDKHGTGWNFENRNAYYDRHGCRAWILTIRDEDDNQVGECEYTHRKKDAMRWLRTGSLFEEKKKV